MADAEVNVMEALANGLRGAIVARPGHQLFVADYAAIEARVVLWLAGAQDALDIFRQGKDIYCHMAGKIYGQDINKHDHPNERQLGKTAVLGLGYGMGAAKFKATCASVGIPIDDTFAQTVVQTYRTAFKPVTSFWYLTEDAALAAVRGVSTRVGPTGWRLGLGGRFLFCDLPSGRSLAYPFPEVGPHKTWWGDVKDTVSHMGVNSYTRQWSRLYLYGGLLVENITQAVSRDIMAEAMLRLERTGVYKPVLSVHDEIIAEAPLGQGSVEEFVALLEQPPVWAPDCPIAAEGWSGTRYRK